MPKESVIRKKAIQLLQDDGWICWFAPKIRFRESDVFGIIDVLALKGKNRKNIQLTTLPNISARRKKITSFLKRNGVELTVEIWAWSKKNKSFKKERVGPRWYGA